MEHVTIEELRDYAEDVKRVCERDGLDFSEFYPEGMPEQKQHVDNPRNQVRELFS